MKFWRENAVLWLIGGFWLIDLLNPVFKKYDYGAEFPLLIVFCVLLVVVGVEERILEQ